MTQDLEMAARHRSGADGAHYYPQAPRNGAGGEELDDGRKKRTEDHGATPPPMSTLGSRAMAIGFTIMLLSVSAGIHFGAGGFGLLLSFTGVLTGANLITIGVRMADLPAPTVQVVFDGARALATLMCCNTAVVGLLMASCAVIAATGEAQPVLCFAMFALLLLAVSLINIGVRGE